MACKQGLGCKIEKRGGRRGPETEQEAVEVGDKGWAAGRAGKSDWLAGWVRPASMARITCAGPRVDEGASTTPAREASASEKLMDHSDGEQRGESQAQQGAKEAQAG